VVVCPSMNSNMYNSAAVQRNLQVLRGSGTVVLEPGSGDLACGTTGPGRLPEPDVILDRLAACLTTKDFSGKRVLVTAGPTREAIDPVRYISNPSTGKMGFAVARAAEHRGASVTLVSGPTALADPANMQVIRVQTAAEMAAAVFRHAETADIVVKTAAVSDYRPAETAGQKIKKANAALSLKLEMNTDILKELGKRKKRQILVGFAAETEALEHNATEKLKEKHLDVMAANMIGEAGSGFGADTNKVTLFYRDGTREPLAMMDKEAVAHTLLDRIAVKIMGAAAGDKK
jgi:phosphopantothenoylcysteine decarboxylase/phosphopantothenate--cysteine ligase